MKELISSADLLKYTSFFKSLIETALDTTIYVKYAPFSGPRGEAALCKRRSEASAIDLNFLSFIKL